MILDKENCVFMSAVLFFLFFVISIISFLFFSDGRVKRTMFFLSEKSHILVGESRQLPVMSTREEDVRVLMEDLILGPFNINNTAILPEGTRINSLFLRKKVLYIDLSDESVIFQHNVQISFSKICKGIEKTLRFNFPWIKKIQFSIHGEPVVFFDK